MRATALLGFIEHVGNIIKEIQNTITTGRCLAVGGLRNGEGMCGLNGFPFFCLFVLKEVLCYALRTLHGYSSFRLVYSYCGMNKLVGSGGACSLRKMFKIRHSEIASEATFKFFYRSLMVPPYWPSMQEN